MEKFMQQFEAVWIPVIIGAIDVIALLGLTIQAILKRQEKKSVEYLAPENPTEDKML